MSRLLRLIGLALLLPTSFASHAYEGKLIEELTAKPPDPDWRLAQLARTFPRPESAWRSGEQDFYEKLLSRGHFDLLVVPFQVQNNALDRTTRSLMTAELALAIGKQKRTVPDPYLVARALGDGERRLSAERVNRLADKLKVSGVVWSYVGYPIHNLMRITIQYQDRSESTRKADATLEVRQLENVPFSDDDPPVEVFQRMLPQVLKAIGLDPASQASSANESAADVNTLPPSPLELVSNQSQPAQDAYSLQLMAALAPRWAERTRERLTEKSMLAVLGISSSAPDYRLLKARAFMGMGLRRAALKTLGTPHSDEERHLQALLNGNLPDVERYSARIKPGIGALIATIELNEIATAYGVRTQKQSLQVANGLRLPGSIWPLLARRAFTDWDKWSQHENAELKALLDLQFPIAGYTAEGIIRGSAALGDTTKVKTALDLSVFDHVRRFTEAQATRWCCEPVVPRLTAHDYLDFLDSIGTDNLVRRAYLTARLQGLPQATLEFLASINGVYKDQPQLTTEQARAEAQLAKEADGARKEGLFKAAYEHAFNAFYWEQGQTRNAADAWDLLAELGRSDYGRLDNLYAADYPFRSLYPGWEAGGYPPAVIANEKARLENSTFDFSPVPQLQWLLGISNDWNAFDKVLKSVEGRFAGNPEKVLLLAAESQRKGDVKAAQRYYREDIKSQPRHWQSYMDLGKSLFEQADVTDAAKVFMDYPEFVKRTGENSVELSNRAYAAGSLFYWSGNFDQAWPLYRIAADLQTGSEASMSSEIRLNLANGNYTAALIGSLERGRRYDSQQAYRDYLGMLHAMGHSQEAWNAFDLLVGQVPNPELWETVLVGHRIAGATESEIAEWVARAPLRKSVYAGVYLLRAAVTDRIPTPQLATALAEVERPVWKLDYVGDKVVRVTVDGRSQVVLNSPSHAVLPLGVFDNAKKVRVKSDLVYYAEAYPLIRRKDFVQANNLLEEAVSLYDIRNPFVGYLLPYYAFAAAKTGHSVAVSARLDTFDVQYQRFDYFLARAVLAGLAGKTAEALRSLNLALHRRPFTGLRPLHTEYQFAEICEWLYEATRNAKYRDVAIKWAKSVQVFSPWFAWPYAMEAKLSATSDERSRAIAMAYYLDKHSERLAKVPKGQITAAVRAFANRNPFLRNPESSKEKST